MQVFKWLFRVAHDQKPTDLSNSEIKSLYVKEPSKEVVSYKKGDLKKSRKHEETSLDCKNFQYLAVLLERRDTRTFFSETLYNPQKSLSRLNTSLQQQHYYILLVKMKEDLIRRIGKNNNVKADSNCHVGNKVLPISDTTSSLSTTTSNADDQKTKDRSNKGDFNNKNKTLSRMKELLRWAAAAKSEKGGKFGKKVMHSRNKSATVKSTGFDDEIANESPKISLRWEVESNCSTISAPPSIKYDDYSRRPGSWITTDDEFVVLEL